MKGKWKKLLSAMLIVGLISVQPLAALAADEESAEETSSQAAEVLTENTSEGTSDSEEGTVVDGEEAGDKEGEAIVDGAEESGDGAQAEEGGTDIKAEKSGDNAEAEESGTDAQAEESGDDAEAEESVDDAEAEESVDDAQAEEGVEDAETEEGEDGNWNDGAKWVKNANGKWQYVLADGYSLKDGLAYIDDALYAFDKDGWMVTGWHKDSGTYYDEEIGENVSYSDWYYFDASGAGHNGWLQYKNQWYYCDEYGYMLNDEWVVDDTGKTYYLKSDGIMATGWYKDSGTYYDEETGETGTYEDWYYFDVSGAQVTGWIKLSGTWYYLDPDYGWMYSDGRWDIDGTEYYFNAKGAMQTGWVKESGTETDEETGETWDWEDWYYFDSNGAKHTGWLNLSGTWYYLEPEEGWGAMYSDGWFYIDGKWYYFKPKGEMVTGWYQYTHSWTDEETGETETYSNWVYCDADGVGHDGWLKYKNNWYYCYDGDMAYDEWIEDNEKTYYMKPDGIMATGWYKDSGTYYNEEIGETETYENWYYFDASGAQVTGWINLSGTWYYLDSEDGWMYSDGCWLIDDKEYWFKPNGAMVDGWYLFSWTNEETGESGSDWMYRTKNGDPYTGWVKSGNAWYYVEDGWMYSNVVYADPETGKSYCLKPNGAMVDTVGWYQMVWEDEEYSYSAWVYVDNKNGELHHGWLTLNGKRYCFDEWGFMYEDGDYEIDGVNYYFDKDGVCTGRVEEEAAE